MFRFKRGKRRILADYKTNDIYKYYKKNYKDILSISQFSQILKLYFDGTPKVIGMFEKMIIDNDKIKLPNRLGTLMIVRYKRIPSIKPDGNIDKTKMIVDWDKTLKLWNQKYPGKTIDELKEIKDKKLIYNLNEHTNMYTVMFLWDKVSSNVKNQYFYNLEVCRQHKAMLAKYLKSDSNLINMYYDKGK